MRQREVGLVQSKVIIGQDIDVERAWSPALLMGTVPPEGTLDRLRARSRCCASAATSVCLPAPPTI